MRIPDADPGDQNHADSCGCGSATLVYTTNFTDEEIKKKNNKRLVTPKPHREI
jgi:hypothetical protein